MSSGFAVTNRLANPVLRRLLRSRLGARPGRRLAVLRYTGRVTGQPHELVVQYVRDRGTVWVLVGAAERKTWWRNLAEPAEVDLWLGGEHHRARARAVRGVDQPQAVEEGLRVYRESVPGAPADPAGAVLVRAELVRG
ncbi:nitroreductase/quinone reductase family protein [Blastococcus sp. TF02A-26]|uniref:nitroreductase/quinone reductase family protein n=1 Tax=Blastococcus sp. TF02A-26 TaxID=2250577 RepID=UPI001314E0E0|nr:nitroreductase/quinone reductase family protein [Blastococcus sp. TF02A-26]